MTARVLVKGILFRAPESRTLKDGGRFVTATVRAKDGGYTQLWHVVAFSDPVQAELRRLSAGDAVAVQGSLKAELYDKDGETELFVGVVAEHALGLRQPGKKRRKEDWAAARRTNASSPPPFIH